MKIFKYCLDGGRRNQRVQMPKGAEFLSAQPQGGLLTVWMAVDPDAPLVDRTFDALVTGENLPFGVPRNTSGYLATVQLGSLVWHLFDRGEA